VKIKRVPEDFQVTEVASPTSGRKGPYGLYELEKRGLSTFEAIGALARHLRRPAKVISAGGLKDKHALTRQFLTISGKPVMRLQLKGLKLTPRGRTDRPMTGAMLEGNRFRITLRELRSEDTELVSERARRAAEMGLPNYFDEQRFGSLRGGEGFIARKLIDGDFEGALRLHLAAPSRLDSSRQRAQRKRMAELWGDWQRAFAALPRSNERSVVNYLRDHPDKFKRAFELIEPRLAQLYLFAYQSYFWNETLAAILRADLQEADLFEIRYVAGRLAFPDRDPEGRIKDLAGLEIPLPSRKADYGEGPVASAAHAALESAGLTLDGFRLRGMKKLRFRAGERAAWVFPQELNVSAAKPDDMYEGKCKLRLDFRLPPGSYATLLLKYVGRELLPGSRASRQAGSRNKRKPER
jgi:tRNA pseudouridine13 synthase